MQWQSLVLVGFSFLTLVSGSVFTVGVGKDESTGKKGIGFDPSAIYPNPGDTIVFEFQSGSHSVVQSTFDSPCTPNGAFNSGVQTVDGSLPVDAPNLPAVQITINDTQPLWFFDQAGGTCNQGGVFSANAQQTGSQTAAAFKENASNAPSVAAPGTSSAPQPSSQPESSATPSPSSNSNDATLNGNVRYSWISGIIGAILLGAAL